MKAYISAEHAVRFRRALYGCSPLSRICICLLGLLGICGAGARHAQADAIVVTRAMRASTVAEIFIERDAVRVEFEIGLSDLSAFRNVLPDTLYERLGHSPEPLEERISKFFTEDWLLRVDDGAALMGRITQLTPRERIRRDEVTGSPLPVQDDAEPVVFLQIQYDLVSLPNSLSLTPPSDPDSNIPTASIGFMVYHLGLPVNDFRYLGTEEILDLDWDDPWYSSFRNRNLRRQYSSPLSVFLYVDHFEVRKEIVVRPKDLQQWVDLGLEGRDTIPIDMQEELKERVADFFLPRGDVLIDGKTVEPILDRIHFIRRSLRRTGIVDPPEDLDINSATLGVIFVYPVAKLPNEVTLDWDVFSPRIANISAAATDEAGGLPSTLTSEDNMLRWRNFLTNPKVPAMVAISPPPAPPRVTFAQMGWVSSALLLSILIYAGWRKRSNQTVSRATIALAAAVGLSILASAAIASVSIPIPFVDRPSLSEEDSTAVLDGLLHNLYRAFDHRDESLVYDRLAQSITGDLLSDVYLQLRKSMELENQGGARAKVDEVSIVAAVQEGVAESSGFRSRCRWNVSGSVGHWGHIHSRANQYEAIFVVEVLDGVWKIASMEFLEESRIDPAAAG